METAVNAGTRVKKISLVPMALASPEPETPRGRKRHRSLSRHTVTATHVGGSGESSTFRGRPPRRSTSPIPVSSRTVSRATGSSLSPTRKKLLQVPVRERRRSQSPSRSRSPNFQQKPARRRQRTRSRSRSHDNATSHRGADISGLRHEILLRPLNGEGEGSMMDLVPSPWQLVGARSKESGA